ncbi:kinetochore protein NDC80 homolog isoform X2 [Eriocheir sinensis]|nr:kinetochore protein NDC80 homolog isoform X2 [Eriocheir sinensis]
MKRASSGRGSSHQPGVLKQRNEDFTPNRQSVGHAARRSNLQKMGQADSAKRVYSRGMRGSTENMSRPSLASSRFTPTRASTTPWAPQSINRMSMDSAHGMSSRKDSRPANDPAFKTQCINKILDFLGNRYPHPLTRRTLLTPSTNDFINIFTFVYQHLESSYVLPTRYEEEIPKLLKRLNYPLQMTKSSFVTVGSPHTWPAVLAMLVFLVDMAMSYNILSQDPASPLDQDMEEGGPRRQSLFFSLYKCDDDEQIFSSLEEFCETLKADENVTEKDMEYLQDEIEAAERTLESLSNTAEEARQLQQCYVQCSDDLRKLQTYCQNLQVAIDSKAQKQKCTEHRLAELGEREIMICEEVDYLRKLQAQQSFSTADLMHFKNHSQEIGREIERQESIGRDIQSQVWQAELEISKIQPSIRISFDLLEEWIGKLDLGDLADLITSYEDVNTHYDALTNKARALKKNAKKSTTHAQNKIWEMDQEIIKVKGVLQEKQTDSKKLETKLRHSKEEFDVAQQEITQEEQMRLEETELLHKQIMEARKTPKKSLYQLQRIKEEKIRELEGCRKREEAALYDGAQFLMKICQEVLQSVEHKDNNIAEYINHCDHECAQFYQWVDGVLQKE